MRYSSNTIQACSEKKNLKFPQGLFCGAYHNSAGVIHKC